MSFSFLWIVAALLVAASGFGWLAVVQERKYHAQSQREELLRKLNRYRVSDTRQGRQFPERAA